MISILNFLTSVKNITANDIPLFQFVDGFDYSKEKVEGIRVDGCYFSIIIDSSPYEIGNPPYLLGDIKISMLYVSKTQNPSFIGNIPLENDIQCNDLEEQGKGVKKFFFNPKDKESREQLNSALEAASTVGEETYVFFQIYGIPRKINETRAPTIFNSEKLTVFSKELSKNKTQEQKDSIFQVPAIQYKQLKKVPYKRRKMKQHHQRIMWENPNQRKLFGKSTTSIFSSVEVFF